MYMHICEMLFLTCTEHTSTMSPVSETQDSDYLHQVKGAVKVWSFRDGMCSIEGQKDMKCVPFAINVYAYVKCSSSHTCTEHTSTMSPELMKLRIITISIKTKVLVKFGTSEMMCVELRAKMCTVCSNMHICEMLFLTCTEHTSTMSPVSETQDYDCLHQVKGAVIIWSFRDDMCRIESHKAMKCVSFAVNVCIYVKCSFSHAQNTLQPCHQLMKLRIMTVCIKLKVLL